MQSGRNLNKERVIYSIVNTVNQKMYVGLTMNLKRRKLDHLSKLRNQAHVNHLLQKDFNKFGEESFQFSTLCKVLGWRNSIDKEKELIKKYDTEKTGYNLTGKKIPKENIKVGMSGTIKAKQHQGILNYLNDKNIKASHWVGQAILEKAKKDGII